KRQECHPLLGQRLWSNQQLPTWKSIINLQTAKHAYLIDHQVQGNIFFPAAGFIELALAAVYQLLSHRSAAPTAVTFERVEFLQACILNKDELTEIYTQIQMPGYKQFSIYSRRYPSTKDALRKMGQSGTDLIQNYQSNNDLHNYTSRQWTLHSTGLIQLQQKKTALEIPSIYNFDTIQATFTDNNNRSAIWSIDNNHMSNLYRYFRRSGNYFGPYFQQIKSLSGTNSKVLAECSQQKEQDEKYYLFPPLLDSCFQSSLILMIGMGANVPISIDKITVFNYDNQKQQKLFVYNSSHSSVNGLTKDYNYSADIILFDQQQKQLIASVENIKIQSLAAIDNVKDFTRYS
ncbi:unnamed protein product, partial [Didymodactylos carnosus]